MAYVDDAGDLSIDLLACSPMPAMEEEGEPGEDASSTTAAAATADDNAADADASVDAAEFNAEVHRNYFDRTFEYYVQYGGAVQANDDQVHEDARRVQQGQRLPPEARLAAQHWPETARQAQRRHPAAKGKSSACLLPLQVQGRPHQGGQQAHDTDPDFVKGLIKIQNCRETSMTPREKAACKSLRKPCALSRLCICRNVLLSPISDLSQISDLSHDRVSDSGRYMYGLSGVACVPVPQ